VTRSIIVNSSFPAYVQNISIGPHQLWVTNPQRLAALTRVPTHACW
jgi:hypothetical protein